MRYFDFAYAYARKERWVLTSPRLLFTTWLHGTSALGAKCMYSRGVNVPGRGRGGLCVTLLNFRFDRNTHLSQVRSTRKGSSLSS